MTSILGSAPSTARLCSWPASLKVTRTIGKKRMTKGVFLDAARAFNTVGIEGLL